MTSPTIEVIPGGEDVPPPVYREPSPFHLWERPQVTCTIQRGRYMIWGSIFLSLVVVSLGVANLSVSTSTSDLLDKTMQKVGKKVFRDLLKNSTFWRELADVVAELITDHQLRPGVEDSSFSPSTPVTPYSSEG